MFVSNSGGGRGYQIKKSLRFRAASSANLSRTFASLTDTTRWTFSGWVKRGSLGTARGIFTGGVVADAAQFAGIWFNPSDQLVVGSGTVDWRRTNRLFRDPAAWYHIVVVFDSNLADSTQRVLVWVNGELQTYAFVSDPSPAQSSGINRSVAHSIGYQSVSVGLSHHDGYLAEINFLGSVSGKTASDFGRIDPVTGVWIAKKYTGTYGTNGFYLDFKDGTSLTTLGYDKSGNGNHWTATNISLTAGVTYDWMDDTPTNNFAVLNPLSNSTTGAGVLASANLQQVSNSTTSNIRIATIPVTSGLVYAEALLNSDNAQQYGYFGLVREPFEGQALSDPGAATDGYAVGVTPTFANYITKKAGVVTQFSTRATGAVTARIAFNANTGNLWLGIGGTWFGGGDPAAGTSPTYSGVTVGTWYFAVSCGNVAGTQSAHVNFGQRPFAYTPPSGFKALCTKNLPAPTIKKPWEHHNSYVLTKIGNTNFTLDWDASTYDTLFWIKRRDAAGDWYQVDGLRGYDKILKITAGGSAETTDANVIGVSGKTCTLKSTLPDGQYIVYAWKAGLSASRQTNTDGTITSTVSRNVIAGFSIVTYNGTLAVGTIGHGLGIVPRLIDVKQRNGAGQWANLHQSSNGGDGGHLGYQFLNTNASFVTDGSFWNSTKPTSSVFSVSNSAHTNPSGGTMVAYCWAEISGYSQFRRFIGNGAVDGTFAYNDLLPLDFYYKRADSAGNHQITDTKRDIANPQESDLILNSTTAEGGGSATAIDLLSNGVKLRNNNADRNANGGAYIYRAFATAPFKYGNAR